MWKAIVAAVAVALCLVAGTSAATPRVTRLEHRLHNMTINRNQFKARYREQQLANLELRSDLEALQTEVTNFRAEVATLQAENDQLRASVPHKICYVGHVGQPSGCLIVP